jgi:hypothetical protein
MAAQAAFEYGPAEPIGALGHGNEVNHGHGGGQQLGHCGGHWRIDLIPVFEGGEGPYSNAGRLWLDKLLPIALRAGWDEDAKLDVALIRLSGEAQTWADSREFINFHDFWKAFEYRFCRTPPNALLLLNNCIKGEEESVGRYLDRFRQICRRLRIDVDLPLLITQYVQGLKVTLCREVFRAKPATFQAALEEATYLETLEQHHVATPRVATSDTSVTVGARINTHQGSVAVQGGPRYGGASGDGKVYPSNTGRMSDPIAELSNKFAKLELLITQNMRRSDQRYVASACNYCHREGHSEYDYKSHQGKGPEGACQ